jgi:glutamate-ammonia-ligase adenylyltransferase
MSSHLRQRAREAVSGSPLAEGLSSAAESLDRLGRDGTFEDLSDALVAGLARCVAAQPETAAFLSHRAGLRERLAAAHAGSLEARERELALWQPGDAEDLETALDALRLLRREDTLLAACLHFSGLVSFDCVSGFLSTLAETITCRALDLARHGCGSLTFSVLGMGKIAGREFTYHSDLDLLFLYEGGAEAVTAASRVGQRLISYLTTMTGAGVAYAVDTRLRPSGRQGMLVTSLPAFERYQSEQARTWEHVALLRARPIAGNLEEAAHTLERVHVQVCQRHDAPWPALLEMRQRVEAERGAEGEGGISLKTGAGGLMDVDFLAGGGLLESDTPQLPATPSVPAMLRAAVEGPGVEALLEDYAALRRVEAAARWRMGRGVESVAADALAPVAELVEPGLSPAGLRERLLATRRRVREAWERVTGAGTIRALEEG